MFIIDESENKHQEPSPDYEAAIQKAYKDGYQKGISDTERKVGEQSQEIFSAVNQLIESKNQLMKDNTKAALHLALTIAKKVIQSEIATNEETLMNVVYEAIEKISSADKVIIRANRADISKIRDNIPLIKSKLSGVDNVLVQEDFSIESGGIILETDMGFVDATLKMKLIYVEKALNMAS